MPIVKAVFLIYANRKAVLCMESVHILEAFFRLALGAMLGVLFLRYALDLEWGAFVSAYRSLSHKDHF